MNASHLKNNVRTREIHGIAYGGIDAFAARRGSYDDRRYAGRLGGRHAHDGGTGMCKPPAGDVAARNIHGDDLLAEHDAWSHFGFKIM